MTAFVLMTLETPIHCVFIRQQYFLSFFLFVYQYKIVFLRRKTHKNRRITLLF